MTSYYRRGEFIALISGMTVVWPLAARAQRAERDLSMTGRYVNRVDDPVRKLSDGVGEPIVAPPAGRKDRGTY